MRKLSTIFIILCSLSVLMISCSKNGTASPTPPTPPVVPTDTTTLKQMASYPVGVAISYDLMKGNSSYSSLVRKEFDRVTFEYQMKHGANVRNDGRSEEHTSELQSQSNLVCRLLLEKKKKKKKRK